MKIGIATFDFWGLVRNGGIGTSSYLLARLLVKHGHEVHVYFTHAHRPEQMQLFRFFQHHFQNEGIFLHELRNTGLYIECDHYAPKASFLLYDQLKSVHHDVLLFPDMSGLGYYCQYAKKKKMAFPNTKIFILAHGSSDWHKNHNEDLQFTLSDKIYSELEKQSLLLAEKVICSTDYSANLARSALAGTMTQVEKCYFPLPEKRSPTVAPQPSDSVVVEFAFFGRLEPRKGILEFLQAAVLLKNLYAIQAVKFTVIGSVREIENKNSLSFLHDWQLQSGIKLNVLHTLDSESAIDYLASRHCVAIVASRAETYGYTFLECMVNNIPVIASDIPPLLEMAEILKLKTATFFKAGDATSLAEKMQILVAEQMTEPKKTSATSLEMAEQDQIHKTRQLIAKSWDAVLHSETTGADTDNVQLSSLFAAPFFVMKSSVQKNVRSPENETASDVISADFFSPAEPINYSELSKQQAELKKYFTNDFLVHHSGFIELLVANETKEQQFENDEVLLRLNIYAFKPAIINYQEEAFSLKAGFNNVELKITKKSEIKYSPDCKLAIELQSSNEPAT